MELKSFIRESLVQIARGIEDANGELADSAAIVNPRNAVVYYEKSTKTYGYLVSDLSNSTEQAIELVEFDVAVQVSTEKEAEGGGRISVFSIGVGAAGRVGTSNESISRLQFKVPMVYPTG